MNIYNSKVLQRARKEIMDNFLQANLALCVTNTSKQTSYNEAFVSSSITDKHLTGHQTYVFPLYLYPFSEQQNLLNEASRSTNINWNLLPVIYQKQPFTSKLTRSFIQTEEAVFYYIYAILYSNIYRKKYN